MNPLLFIVFLNTSITVFLENCEGKQVQSVTEVQTLWVRHTKG